MMILLFCVVFCFWMIMLLLFKILVLIILFLWIVSIKRLFFLEERLGGIGKKFEVFFIVKIGFLVVIMLSIGIVVGWILIFFKFCFVNLIVWGFVGFFWINFFFLSCVRWLWIVEVEESWIVFLILWIVGGYFFWVICLWI